MGLTQTIFLLDKIDERFYTERWGHLCRTFGILAQFAASLRYIYLLMGAVTPGCHAVKLHMKRKTASP